MKPLLLAFLLLSAQARFVFAQSASAPTQTELIENLAARIEQLEKRIADLEGPKTPAATPGQPHAAAAMQMGSPAGTAEGRPTLNIAGFGDYNFGATDQPGTRSGFTEGQFILHLNANLSSRVSFLGEVSLSARTDAGTGTPPATGFNAEVERSIVRFEHNDHLK